MPSLAQIARRADAAAARARAELVSAVQASAAEGLTQAEIAREIGRSQPEVSRLLHFHGTGPRAMALRKHRGEILRLIKEAGGRNVRLFGSVATGKDIDGSDIDLLFTMERPLGLLGLARLEAQVSSTVGYAVDLVPDSSLIPVIRDRILREAIPL